MTRSLQQLKQPAHQADHAPDQDSLEAEHDPAVSRRASLADLRRHDPADQANDAPSQAQAESALIFAFQAHAKLTAARMHAAAATIRELLQSDTSGPAGTGPMEAMIDAQIEMVNGALDSLALDMNRVPKLLLGTLTPELNAVYGAFHESWAPALNRVYAALDKKDLVTNSRAKMQNVLRMAGKEESDMTAVLAPRRNRENLAEQRDEELVEAELEALKTGMRSVELAIDLVKANFAKKNPSDEVRLLLVSVKQLADVFEPINPDHIGSVVRMPILMNRVEELKEELKKKDPALLGVDGGATFTTSIHRITAKLAVIASRQQGPKGRR